jgi:alpha-glucosidase
MKKSIGYYCVLLLGALIISSCTKQTALVLKSPDENLTISVSSPSKLCYNVNYKGSKLIGNAPLGFILKDGDTFKENLRVTKTKTNTVDEPYEIVFGKRKQVRNHCNELLISFEEKNAPKRKIQLEIRAYNEAVAFRYLFPEQPGLDSIIILDESTNFSFTENPEAFFLPRTDYTTSHEGYYSSLTLDEAPVTLIDLPMLLKFQGRIWMALTEANLTDYAGMYLAKTQGTTPNLISSLSPYPGHKGIKVLAKTPHKTPWRVIMVSDRLSDLFESDVIINLNDPSVIEDPSWIRPGKSTWHWWNGTVLKNVNFESGMNFETMKLYIDFCARNNIPYHSLVEFKGPWYQDPERQSWTPGPTADVTSPRPELQMEKLIDYAREKGVGLRLWVHWKALNMKMDEAFELYHKWGIKGLMVDFMDRDDQEMVNFYHNVLQKAVKYQLHIQFHGAYKPTGIRRTYPNLLTTEAVLNTEYQGTCNPEHNLMVPFTRMLAGPMDYHLGGFHSVRKEDNCGRGEVYGTRCHQLAMYVVYESYLQLLCDYPSAYEGQIGFEFVKQVPTTWDDIKFINGEVGDYITIARRSNDDWYVGSMTDWTGREIKIPLDFLSDGQYNAEIYADAADADENPNNLIKKTIQVTNKDTISAKLASGGGQVMYLKRIK